MEKQPQFPFAPKDFARCLNATCPRSQNCLRRTAALQDTDEHLFLKVVNPLRYPKEGEECELFRSTDKVRMAWGVTHLLDNVPYKEGSLLRNMIINHLGRSQYYRCFRKERPFSPQDQQTIRLLFRQRGISEEPSFDYYTNEVSVSAILSCRPFFILIFLPYIKMNHYGFSRKSIWKNLETFP